MAIAFQVEIIATLTPRLSESRSDGTCYISSCSALRRPRPGSGNWHWLQREDERCIVDSTRGKVTKNIAKRTLELAPEYAVAHVYSARTHTFRFLRSSRGAERLPPQVFGHRTDRGIASPP